MSIVQLFANKNCNLIYKNMNTIKPYSSQYYTFLKNQRIIYGHMQFLLSADAMLNIMFELDNITNILGIDNTSDKDLIRYFKLYSETKLTKKEVALLAENHTIFQISTNRVSISASGLIQTNNEQCLNHILKIIKSYYKIDN